MFRTPDQHPDVELVPRARRGITNAAPDGRVGDGARLRRALFFPSPAGELQRSAAMSPMSSPTRRLLLSICLCAIGVFHAAPASAQAPARYRFALGVFQQSTASVADKGWTLGFHRSLSLSAVSALELGIDFARVSSPAQVGFCEVIANDRCVARGGPQTALTPQLGLRFQSASARTVHPFLTLGGATILSLDDPTSSARPTLVAPQVSSGVAGQGWTVDVRLRGLRRWEGNAYRQVALHLGKNW